MSEKFWLGARMRPTSGAGKPKSSGKRFPLVTRLESTTVDQARLFRWSVAPRGRAIAQSFALAESFAPRFVPARINEAPLSLEFTRPAEARIEIEFELPESVRCLGLGERYSGLNLRSRIHTLLTTDDHRHIESTDSLYKSIPVLYLTRGSQAVLLFVDSPAPQRWNLDSRLEERAKVELHTRRGFSLYLAGPAPLAELVRLYTCITGRTPLPPRWALGHQPSRWSYPDEGTLRSIAREFRARRIPCDTVVADIDYLEDYRVFSISRERFPNFERLTEDLRRDGFRLVPIIDPGVKCTRRDPVYREGMKRDIFCKTAEGKPFVGKVWAGDSCLPDFLKETTRQFWGEQIAALMDRGVAGIWNDMNEPALFGQQRPYDPGTEALPPKEAQLFLQTTPEGPEGHFEVRGLYGMQMARAAFEAQQSHRPNERPFTLTRSTYAGGQRYGAVWLGDNHSWFEHLRRSIPMLLNIGLSGFPFAGVDIGGFSGHSDAELLVRWYELGIFYPFFRNHCAMGHVSQEPWAFGPKVERLVRRLIETRYSLTRYIEGLFVEHQETGAPLMRPMAYHYGRDEVASAIDDQFLFGRELLVAPILERGKRERVVYFPKGVFESFDGTIVVEGPCHKTIPLSLGTVPAFVRHGAILPLTTPFEHMGQLERARVLLRCYGAKATGRLWLDDGATTPSATGNHGDYRLTLSGGRFSAEARHEGKFTGSRTLQVEALGKRFEFELP